MKVLQVLAANIRGATDDGQEALAHYLLSVLCKRRERKTKK